MNIQNYKCSYILFIGLILYFMGNQYLQYFATDSICSMVSLIGISLIIIALLFYSKKQINLDQKAKVLFFCFIISNFLIIVYGFVDSGFNIGKLFSAKRDVSNYLTPLLLFCFYRCFKLRPYIKICILSCILGVLFIIFNFKQLILTPAIETMGFYDNMIVNMPNMPLLCITPCFLLLLYKDTPTKVKQFIFIISILALFCVLLSGRRSASFTIIICYICYLLISMKNIKMKILIIFCSFILFIFLPLLLDAFNDYFYFLVDRIGEDTRSGVEKDMVNDMDFFSWIFGRGLYGTYYSPTAIDYIHRSMIETGYLNMILKGGIINLLLYVLLLIRTIYNGIFRSKNNLGIAFGYLALMHLILLYPGGHIIMNFEFCIVWFGIAFCNNVKLNNASNCEIKRYISE